MSTKPRQRRPHKQIVVDTNTSPPMAHTHYQSSRHLHPERFPTARGERCVSLRLMDVSSETIEHVKIISNNIKRLFASRLKLKTVPDSLMESLVNLEKLDLSHNQLSDGCLPDALKIFESLIELNLSANNFTKVPGCIKKLKNLSRLDLSYNKIENLKGIEKSKKLQILVVDHNRIDSIFKEISSMRKLQVLHCEKNKIREVGHDIRHLKSLRELYISQNKVITLPVDIFQLPQLEVLDASENNISRVPTFSVKVQNKHCISDIDLSQNSLVKFPEHLLLVSDKLDLSGNSIKTIGWNVITKLDWNTKQKLHLDDNPLTSPPPDVCDSGLRTIIRYLQESRIGVRTYQGVKILVLGSQGSGKTSLVQTIVDEQPRLAEELIDPMTGVDTYEASYEIKVEESEKTLRLCIWDFCGHPFYLYPHYMFFEDNAITVLTFNMAEYTPEKFLEMVGSWFDWMIAKTNKLVVAVVGTNADRLTSTQIESVCSDVKEQLTKHLENHRKMLEERIHEIEAKPHISPSLSEQLKTYMGLLKAKFSIQSDIIVTSAKKYLGFDKLQSAIESLANDKKLFANVLRPIPTFWSDVENYIEERGNSMWFPILEWDEYFSEVTDKFGMKHLIKYITQYLHDSGKLLWFSNVPALQNYVFLRPSWLFDLLKQIFRHDINESIHFVQDDYFKQLGVTLTKFSKCKKELLDEGIVEKDFLRCLFGDCIPVDDTGTFDKMVSLLLEAFELGYPVYKRSRDTNYTLTVEQSSDGSVKMSRILFPWFRKCTRPEYLDSEIDGAAEKRRVVAKYKFPKYMPPGLFERLCVHAHRPGHKLKYLSQWGGGVHAKHLEEAVNVLISYKQQSDDSVDVRFDLRDDSEGEDQVPAATLWSILFPLLTEFETLIQGYVGVWVERCMECPLCNEASFLGEWLNPKETQNLPTKICDSCGQNVDTAFLVQPKEKKRDDVLYNLSKRNRRRQALIQSSMQPSSSSHEDPIDVVGERRRRDHSARGIHQLETFINLYKENALL